MDLYFAVIDFKKTRPVNQWKIHTKTTQLFHLGKILALPGMSQHVVMDVLSKEHHVVALVSLPPGSLEFFKMCRSRTL